MQVANGEHKTVQRQDLALSILHGFVSSVHPARGALCVHNLAFQHSLVSGYHCERGRHLEEKQLKNG